MMRKRIGNDDLRINAGMKTGAGPFDGLNKLFIDELKDIYWAEKATAMALPKMINAASSEELADELLDHLTLTFDHISRLEGIFVSLGVKSEATKCEMMNGLIEETLSIITTDAESKFKDQGILSVSKKMQYYKITSYGILCSFAKTLSEIEVLSVLEDTLNEEREVYRIMTQISEFLSLNDGDEDAWKYFDLKKGA
jgi:ferritin-like metal-binding protein YciE